MEERNFNQSKLSLKFQVSQIPKMFQEAKYNLSSREWFFFWLILRNSWEFSELGLIKFMSYTFWGADDHKSSHLLKALMGYSKTEQLRSEITHNKYSFNKFKVRIIKKWEMRLFLLFQSLAKIVHFIDIFSILDFNW